jgi:hypothetical protein
MAAIGYRLGVWDRRGGLCCICLRLRLVEWEEVQDGMESTSGHRKICVQTPPRRFVIATCPSSWTKTVATRQRP